MNILQLEDMVKGMPDDYLMREAQQPSGQFPQFLTFSEIQRRTDMRKRFAGQQQQPQGTVADQIMQQGIAALRPQGGMPQQGMPQGVPQGMPQQMARGGIVRMANMGQVPGTMLANDGFGRLVRISTVGFPNEQAAYEAMWNKQNEPIEYLPEGTGNPAWQARFDPQGNLMQDIQEAVPAAAPSDGFDWGGIGLSLKDTASRVKQGIADSDFGKAMSYYGDAYGDYLSGLREEPANIRRHIGAAMDIWGPQVEGLGESVWDTGKKVAITTKELGRGVASQLGFETDEGPFTRGPAGDIERLEQLTAMLNGENKKDPQVQGRTGAQVQGTGKPAPVEQVASPEEGGIAALMASSESDEAEGPLEEEELSALEQLLAMKDAENPVVPDMTDLIKQQNKDAFNMALIQLGAGIAGNDLSGGLARAGAAAMQGRAAARDLEARAKLLGYKAKNDDLDRDIGILSRAAQIESTAEVMSRTLLQQQHLDRRSIVQSARQMVTEAYKESMTVYKTPSDRLKAMQQDYKLLLQQLSANMGIELPDEDYVFAPVGAGAASDSGGAVDWSSLP